MSAVVLPHPALSGAQLELVCRREGLAVEHVGDAIFRLVQTSAPRRATTHIRIAVPALTRQEIDRAVREALTHAPGPEPEAA